MKNLIKRVQSGEITRAEFCHRLAKKQGFNDIVKGYADQFGNYIRYRGITANVIDGVIVWYRGEKKQTARSIKEMKIKMDYSEMGVMF